jgi:hypothetical protein
MDANAKPQPVPPLPPLIDEPGMFDTPETWERHLNGLQSLPDSPARASMIEAVNSRAGVEAGPAEGGGGIGPISGLRRDEGWRPRPTLFHWITRAPPPGLIAISSWAGWSLNRPPAGFWGTAGRMVAAPLGKWCHPRTHSAPRMTCCGPAGVRSMARTLR